MFLERSKATFIKKVRTAPRYQLYRISWYPGMVEEEGSVEGEVYSVSDECLAHLDQYEGVPTLFRRGEVELEDGTTAISYFFNMPVGGRQRVKNNNWIEGPNGEEANQED